MLSLYEIETKIQKVEKISENEKNGPPGTPKNGSGPPKNGSKMTPKMGPNFTHFLRTHAPTF